MGRSNSSLYVLKCKVLPRFIATLGFFFISLFGRAQVVNDLIADRVTLEINNPFRCWKTCKRGMVPKPAGSPNSPGDAFQNFYE